MSRITDLHRKYLAAFYEGEFDEPDKPLLSSQKRRTIPRARIQAALATIREIL
jgi:hypothetical protein